MDALSAVVDGIRLGDSRHLELSLGEDHAVQLDSPGVAGFHALVEGEAWYTFAGGEPTRIRPGELLLFSAGVEHRILVGDPGRVRVHNMAELLDAPPGRSRLCRLGDPAARALLLTGQFRVDALASQRLSGSLPPVIHVRANPLPPTWLVTGIRFIRDELGADQPGNMVILNRLMDITLVQCVRYCLDNGLVAGRGWLAGLADTALARALAVMHAEPDGAWRLEALAKLAGLSRAVFAARFREQVGETPIEYLTSVRMTMASRLLRETALPLEQVARRCGYESSQAFNRAFQRRVGQSPGRYRRAQSGTSVPAL